MHNSSRQWTEFESKQGRVRLLCAPLDALTSTELYQLFQLRVDTFIVGQNSVHREIDDVDGLPSTKHLLLYDASTSLIGCARLFPVSIADIAAHIDRGIVDTSALGNEIFKFGRFIAAPVVRGKGLAQHILTHALSLSSGRAVFLDAQSPLVSYYERFGFSVCRPEFLETGIPHTPMILLPRA